MNWFLNNREVIRNLALNTGTSAVPVFTNFCTTSEVNLEIDTENKEFYVFCDAIKRSVITGAKLTLKGTIKIDMNNSSIIAMLGDIHTLIKDGSVAQFNNQLVQFELIEKITGDVLTYVKYQVPVTLKLSDIGGNAEDEGDFGFEMTINGKGTTITA